MRVVFSSRLTYEVQMRFSDAVAASDAADSQVNATSAKLVEDKSAAHTARGVVVNAIVQKGGTIALPTPAGDVRVFKVDADNAGFTVETLPGDFDLS